MLLPRESPFLRGRRDPARRTRPDPFLLLIIYTIISGSTTSSHGGRSDEPLLQTPSLRRYRHWAPLRDEPLWIHEHLDYHARRQPDAELVRCGGRATTYAEGAERSDRIAAALAARTASGDRVAVLAKNCTDYALLYAAASKAGVVPVPLNYRLAPPEWQYILADSGARMLLAQSAFCEGIDDVRSVLPDLEHCAVLDGAVESGWAPLEAWLGEPIDAEFAHARRCDDVWQLYTSGTTGRPKGAVLTQAGVFATLYQWRVCYPIFPRERQLQVMPLYHIAGALLVFHFVGHGSSMLLMQDFDPHEVVRLLDEKGIATTTLVPAMIQACLTEVPDVAERRYERFRFISYGASPIAEATLRRAMQVFGCDFIQGFGMTECPNLVYLTPEDHRRALAGETHLLLSTGRAGPGSQVKIVDEAGREVPPGTVGEICGRGPQTMRGYWNQPKATAEALRDGWMHTGDAGYLDEEGYLYIKDRIKDMIVSGGENVYPREVEDVLFRHPAVADVAVIGVPSERWGETVKAIVVLRADQRATEEELIAYCQQHLAGFKRPRSIGFSEELPRNPSGKVLKRILREPYWAGHARRVS
ncbi:MAG: long-chain-fatty-acid--CoA ligase [Proteobacteria bacterium]|nr:long-chain-fatty-acid--CoA ligase [Pseudomonadota bacterium]